MSKTKVRGFTLIELMVGMAIGALTIVGVYKIFASQQQIYLTEARTVQLQQNVRATLNRLVEEIRMAGYDPRATGSFGFAHHPNLGEPDYGRATSSEAVYFSVDANGNGILDDSDLEQIGFRLNVAQDGSTLDGSAGKEPDHVLRKYSCGAVKWQPMAQDIEAIRFVYFDRFDSIIPEADLAARLSDIRSVQIVIIGRQTKQEKHYTNRTVYRDPQSAVVFAAPGDHLRRRMLSTTVACRNRVQPW